MDARRTADVLGIPFYVWDFSERFAEAVVDDFVAEYAAGRTPNPCLRCNERIKFAALLDKAVALGFDAVCTGHYALVTTDAEGRRELHRASDEAKDQSYVLGVLTADQLAHAMFPLGRTPSKALVRAEAERRGFRVASKPDSHDICFIPDGDTRGWLADRLGSAPGPGPRHRRRRGRPARGRPRLHGRAAAGALAHPAGTRRAAALRARGEARVEHRRRRAARGRSRSASSAASAGPGPARHRPRSTPTSAATCRCGRTPSRCRPSRG